MGKELAGSSSQAPGERRPAAEHIGNNHFYAAYVYDDAANRAFDICTLIDEAQRLGYPLRYWWLSSAMELNRQPDRLIVCAHHPSGDENAGMDLYSALYEWKATYSALEAATPDEYVQLGRTFRLAGDIHLPTGEQLFPAMLASDEDELDYPSIAEMDRVIALTVGDLQSTALEALNRFLTDEEIASIARDLQGHLDHKLIPLITRLEDRSESPATENGEHADYLVAYTLAGYTLTKATSGHAASEAVSAALHRMLSRSSEEGVPIAEARELHLHELEIGIDSVVSTAFTNGPEPT